MSGVLTYNEPKKKTPNILKCIRDGSLITTIATLIITALGIFIQWAITELVMWPKFYKWGAVFIIISLCVSAGVYLSKQNSLFK